MKNKMEIDENLAVETTIERKGICFCDVERAPFKIYSVFKESGL